MEFPEGLEKIGSGAFQGSRIEHVEFSASLRAIARGAFAKCKCLRTVKFSEGLEVLGADEYPPRTEKSPYYCGVFEGSGIECAELPPTLRRIEYCAFKYCTALTSIRLPE